MWQSWFSWQITFEFEKIVYLIIRNWILYFDFVYYNSFNYVQIVWNTKWKIKNMIGSGQNNNRCFAISTQSNEVVIGQGFLWESCKKWFDFNGGRSSFITWKNWKDKKWNKKYIKSKGKTKGDKSFVITQYQISLMMKSVFVWFLTIQEINIFAWTF